MEYTTNDYWLESSHTGYNFDIADSQNVFSDIKLPAGLRKEESSQFNPLRCSGLDEAVENSSSSDTFIHRCTFGAYVKYIEYSNPLLPFQKNRKGKTGRSGPENTVRNMILGFDYSLYEYKSKKDKLELLEAAEKTHDGNTILEVVLFLRATFKKSIFQKEIMDHTSALNVYLAYLEEDHERAELATMLMRADKAEDLALIKYEAAVNIEDPQRKLQLIEHFLSTDFQLLTNPLLKPSVEEHCRILKEQIEFFKNSLACSVGDDDMMYFEKLTGKKSVIDSSVICSLMYGCFFYYKSEMSHILTCPQKLVSSFSLTKKQFTWAALRALAPLKKWDDIYELFMTKNWLGSYKVRSCISFERILEELYKVKPPTEVLSKYVSCIEDEQERLILAERYCCHSVAIEVFKNTKDRMGLMKYKGFLAPDSAEFCSIIEALNNPAIKWKN